MTFVAIFDYQAQPHEIVGCNLCGKEPFAGDLEPDRYGYTVRVRGCNKCGLEFLSRRMTKDAYKDFYVSGAYRRLVSAFHGRDINAQTLKPEQREYAAKLGRLLETYINGAASLLDVGGSTGVVAEELAAMFGFDATVMDPAPAELAEAKVRVLPGMIEDYEVNGLRWDVVTLCQTIDHLLDPMSALKKIKAVLNPGGLFWVDIVDFNLTHEVKIDHPYNFTERTAKAYLAKAGFEVLAQHRDGNHLGFVCRA